MWLTPSCDCPPESVSKACPVHSNDKLVAHNAHLAEMAEQDRVWKERRMVSGHGAQDGIARDPNYKALIVFLGGPIKHWWDENWMTPPHLRYDEWRSKVEEACIAAGFLVYKPYTAWKGTWNEQAQLINNTVIQVVDVFLDLTPPGVPSAGTEEERAYAEHVGTEILDCPPPARPPEDAQRLEDLVKVLTYDADMKNAPTLKKHERSV
jgi:hypothetical protein